MKLSGDLAQDLAQLLDHYASDDPSQVINLGRRFVVGSSITRIGSVHCGFIHHEDGPLTLGRQVVDSPIYR